MERSYRRGHVRRRSPVRSGEEDAKARRSAIKLTVCAGLFVLAALIKLMFPAFFTAVGGHITAAVDYNAALTVLGEGLSGERKFTTAVGEAFTYAFRGGPYPAEEPSESTGESDVFEDSAETFGDASPSGGESVPDTAPVAPDDGISTDTGSLSDAIIAAFMQTQEGYSDYNLPAGATYDMPTFGVAYAAPVPGHITSGYGYRQHPEDNAVKFHYGVDLAAEEGSSIAAFADGEVIAVGESTTLGKYVLISHDGSETKYGHCSEILVSSGQAVKMGDEIALAGSTGNATSSCLHFELLIGGVWVNPEYYLSLIDERV